MSTSAHKPVLLREVISALEPADNRIYVDATYGAGGYTQAILNTANCQLYGFDRDPNAIEAAAADEKEYAGRLHLIGQPFSQMQEALAARDVESVDGVVMDLGVSSMQLDQAERGFSFMRDGPLSMRMDAGKPDAGDVIAHADVDELATIFKVYGEEKQARSMARAIVSARDNAPVETTLQLAAILERFGGPPARRKIHPATRVFQALRIFVNDEIGQLITGLKAAERLLRPAGRLVVVTFHSLEDRIVKRFIANRVNPGAGASRHSPDMPHGVPSFEKLHAKIVAPSDDEIAENPRSRSAKLRGAVRSAAPVLDDPAEIFGLVSNDLIPNLERKFAI